MQRYFSDKKIDNMLLLNDDDIYHIKTVMRMNNKDKIQVVYNKVPYLCEVCLDSNMVNIIDILEQKEDRIPFVTLFIPILKEQKMDYILQKSTELGVSEIVPVIMERSVVKVGEKEIKKLERWNRIIKEASEQSMRNIIPNLKKIIYLKDIENKGLNLICSTTEEKNSIKKVFQKNNDCGKISMVVGPEGGLSVKEEQILMEKGFIPVTLGSRIMRVETVPLYLMSIINYEYME